MNLRPMRALWALLILPLIHVCAQQRIDRNFTISQPDTPAVVIGQLVDPAMIRGEKSAGLAILFSAVLPGAGQAYTERWLSIPFIWGFGYYFGKQASDLNILKQDYTSRYDASVRADTVNHEGDSQLRDIRDFYRDERDRFAIYMGLTYLLNIVDAYVGAALYGFDVAPALDGESRLTLRIRILQPPSNKR